MTKIPVSVKIATHSNYPKENGVLLKMDAFTLKGSLYTLTTLHLKEADLTAVDKQLSATVKQAPKFFDNTPVVIDLQEMAKEVNIAALIDCLHTHKLIPVGVRGGNKTQKEVCLAAGLAIMPETQKASDIPAQTSSKKTLAADTIATPSAAILSGATKLITQPVRSGQQIYAQGGDLVILAPVSAGAEVLADGHIHIYAPLRGRALAGVQGNTQARIFCQQLEAELIAIAGHYKVSEQLKDQVQAWEKSAVVYLDNDQLAIQPL
jgi:septum site-determining protein MinC